MPQLRRCRTQDGQHQLRPACVHPVHNPSRTHRVRQIDRPFGQHARQRYPDSASGRFAFWAPHYPRETAAQRRRTDAARRYPRAILPSPCPIGTCGTFWTCWTPLTRSFRVWAGGTRSCTVRRSSSIRRVWPSTRSDLRLRTVRDRRRGRGDPGAWCRPQRRGWWRPRGREGLGR